MKNLISLKDINIDDLFNIFNRADDFVNNPFKKTIEGKTVIMFFPETSIRTRVTFEKAIYNMGGNRVLFPSETLDKKEKLEDVIGYLNNWADCIIVRYNDINLINEISKYSKCPVINGLSDVNHPCEVITDLYSLYKMDKDILSKNFLYVGPNRNIGMAWREASVSFGISFTQSCPKSFEIEGANIEYNLSKAIKNADVLITDSLPSDLIPHFKDYQITEELLNLGKKSLFFNPCPPFYRGEEVLESAIKHPSFVGYSFKKNLLNVQQAIIDFCCNE